MKPVMQAAQPHVSVRVLYPFAAALSDEGVDLDLVLATAEISRATYYDRDSRIRIASARRFHFAAAASSRDPGLGLAAARHFGRAHFQILEYLAATSTHLGAALDTLVKSERILSDVSAIRLEPRDEGVLVRVEPLTPGWHRCWVEFVVAAIYLAGRRILPAPLPGAACRAVPWFAYPASACAADYQGFFGTGARLNAPASGLWISRDALQERLESADTRLHEVLEDHLSDLALQAAPKASLLERARALLCKSLPDGDSCLDAMATSLHMSPRTFRRRLRQEGVTHRSLLQEVRRDLALSYLKERDINIDDVAYRIGYRDSTAFHKAFKRWTGNTPAEHRARMQSGPEDPSRPRSMKPVRH